MRWSPNGSTLAILLKINQVVLWNPIKGTSVLETGIKGLELLEWSQDSELVTLQKVSNSLSDGRRFIKRKSDHN